MHEKQTQREGSGCTGNLHWQRWEARATLLLPVSDREAGRGGLEEGGVWRDIRGTEARKLVIFPDVNKFSWDLTDRDQGNFETQMMTYLWFNERITPHDRKRVQLDLQQALVQTRDAGRRAPQPRGSLVRGSVAQ